MATLGVFDKWNKRWHLSIAVLVALFSTGLSIIEQIPVPRGLENCFNRYAAKTSITQTVGQSINWICVHQYTWAMNGKQGWMTYNITSDVNKWFGDLLQFSRRRNVIRFKRQTRRARKEIRMMTEKERYNFFRACQMMKADRSVYPNRYDALAALHQGIAETAAHGGPNFVGWHRVFLIMFENALREYIPSVTIPYWDSTLDDKMKNPTTSIIWTPQFFGTGNGIVNDGPFGGWMTPSGPLIRNIGNGGQLFRMKDIRNILTRRRLMEITEPLAPTSHNLEFHHGEVHLYVDGQMSDLTTASHDPLFFLHHCYVDYVWEIFRKRQRMMGINPERDYPMIVNHTLHTARAPLGLGRLRNIDSFSESMIAGLYHYEPSPHCSATDKNCGPNLNCEYMDREWTCVSKDRSAAAQMRNMGSGIGNQMTNIDRNILRNTQQMRGSRAMGSPPRTHRPVNRNMNMVAPSSSGDMNFDLHRIMKANNIDPNIMIPVLTNNDRQKMFARASMGSNISPNTMIRGSPIMINTHRGNMMVSVQRDRSNPNNFEINGLMMNQTLRTGFAQQQVGTIGRVPIQNIFPPSATQSRAQQNTAPPQSSSTAKNNQEETCPAIPVNRPYQNTFNINGRSDTRQWVYMAVNIVYRRPPEYKQYDAFPIYNSRPNTAADIYSPAGYSMIKTRLGVGNPASYRFCNTGKSGAGAVFVQSNGINYIGNYKEYAIVDHRMAISMSTAFVAVKNPALGVTEVLLSAYDSCGRVCRPYCRDPGSDTGDMRRCTGMLRINSQAPRFYGNNYGEAVYNAWNLKGTGCPIWDRSNTYMTFYCDYEESWSLPGTVPKTPPPSRVMMMPNPMVMTAGMRVQPAQTSMIVCKLPNGCIFRDRCAPCIHGATRRCEGTCSLYAKCNRGIYQTALCRDGRKYNPQTGKCDPGTCPEEETPPPLRRFFPTTPSPMSKTTIFDDR